MKSLLLMMEPDSSQPGHSLSVPGTEHARMADLGAACSRDPPVLFSGPGSGAGLGAGHGWGGELAGAARPGDAARRGRGRRGGIPGRGPGSGEAWWEDRARPRQRASPGREVQAATLGDVHGTMPGGVRGTSRATARRIFQRGQCYQCDSLCNLCS
jgi:hypothetical protein